MHDNLLADLPDAPVDEQVTVLLETKALRVERIVSHGQRSPDGFWYDQPQHEWVAVLQGAARLRFEDGSELNLKTGDFVQIPAHRKHRVEWTSIEHPTVWLTIHYLDTDRP